MSTLDFEVVPTNETYMGKTYSQLIAEWCNWFFMINPDQYNQDSENNIKYLRSFPSPAKIAAYSPGERIPFEGSPMYLNTPNIMTGPDKIVMYEDQAIFFPVILALWINDDDKDLGFMQRWVRNENFNSDNPPASTQFTIDGLPIMSSEEVIQHKIDSNGVFMLNIPNAVYGTSLKDFVIDPSPPGWYEAYCQGYYILVKNLIAGRTYRFYSRARGAPYSAGPYYSSFQYEIQVLSKTLKPTSPTSGLFPERLFDSITDDLLTQEKSGKLSESQAKKLLCQVQTSKKSDLCYVESKGKEDALQYAIIVLILGEIRNKLIGYKDQNILKLCNDILDRLDNNTTDRDKTSKSASDRVSIDSTKKEQVEINILNVLCEYAEKTENIEIKESIQKLREWYDGIVKYT